MTGPFAGDPPDRERYILDQTIAFHPAHWTTRIPSQAWPTALSGCPVAGTVSVVTRRDVFDIASAGNPIHTMVAAFVWGTGAKALGPRGGATRLARIFAQPLSQVASNLSSVLQLQASTGSIAAYAALRPNSRNLVKWLGPSFFTKVLYFSGWHEHPGAPLILDQFVVKGLNKLRGTRWRVLGPWSPAQYGEYLEWTSQQATTWTSPTTGMAATTDVVERRIWEHGKK